MSALIVDTSVWIATLKGASYPLFEQALQHGEIFLLPLVYAELLSGAKSQKEIQWLEDFLNDLPLFPTGQKHWKKVGLLRGGLLKKGYLVSIPDCHIAQCTLDIGGTLLTEDKIFMKISPLIHLKLA